MRRRRPGPKFIITLAMAIANLRAVRARFGVATLSYRLYEREGSFCADTLVRKFGWRRLCQLAGLPPAPTGRPTRPKGLCLQGCGRPRYHVHQHCRTCWRRLHRQRDDLA